MASVTPIARGGALQNNLALKASNSRIPASLQFFMVRATVVSTELAATVYSSLPALTVTARPGPAEAKSS